MTGSPGPAVDSGGHSGDAPFTSVSREQRAKAKRVARRRRRRSIERRERLERTALFLLRLVPEPVMVRVAGSGRLPMWLLRLLCTVHAPWSRVSVLAVAWRNPRAAGATVKDSLHAGLYGPEGRLWRGRGRLRDQRMVQETLLYCCSDLREDEDWMWQQAIAAGSPVQIGLIRELVARPVVPTRILLRLWAGPGNRRPPGYGTLANDATYDAVRRLVVREDCPAEVLAWAATHPADRFRRLVAEEPDVAEEYRILAALHSNNIHA